MKALWRARLAAIPGVVIVLALGISHLAGAAPAVANPCPASWFPLSTQPASVQQQCAQLRLQANANAYATAEARPYATSVITPVNPAINGTPVPPGYAPPDAGTIAALPVGVFQGVSSHPEPITSVWQVGSVSSPDPATPGYGRVIVFAVGPSAGVNAYISRLVFVTGSLPGSLVRQYAGGWVSPRNVGTITIAGVTGPTGVVSLTTSSGTSGTLNMATGAWTFNP
jgi:hypothetical protein